MSKDVLRRFIEDTEHHEMEVMRDDGVYGRQIRFKAPRNSFSWFDLVTWPGVLCINGDHGSYVFSRSPDMFQFFSQGQDRNGDLAINEQYWAEKLVASACHGRNAEGIKRWSSEDFTRRVKERYIDHIRRNMSGMPEERAELRRYLEWDLLAYADEQDRALRHAGDFNEHGLDFKECWEWDCTDWDFHFVWCLYAIVWGIRQYNAALALKLAA